MTRTSGAIRTTRQRGAILILMAMMIVPLTVMTAVVVDLGLVRWQRATMQNSVDSAAVAAGKMLSAKGSGSANGDGLPQAACIQALASLRQNLSGFTSTDVGDAGGCAGQSPNPPSKLPTLVSTCVSSNMATQTLTATSGNYTATLTYPIAGALLTADQQNAVLAAQRVAYVGTNVATVTPNSQDARCRVMGVQVTRSNMPSYFGGAVGATSQSANAHADGATPATSTTLPAPTTTTTLPCNPTQDDDMTALSGNSAFTRNPSSGGGGTGTTLTANLKAQTPGCTTGINVTWTIGKTQSYADTVQSDNLSVVNAPIWEASPTPPVVMLSNIEKASFAPYSKDMGWVEATVHFSQPVTNLPQPVTNFSFTIDHLQLQRNASAFRQTLVWLSDTNDVSFKVDQAGADYTYATTGIAIKNGTYSWPWRNNVASGSSSAAGVNVLFHGPITDVKLHFDIWGKEDWTPPGWGDAARVGISNMKFTH